MASFCKITFKTVFIKPTMQVRYFVIDQNQMRAHRAPEVLETLKNSPDVHFIVPDAAIIEMTKSRTSREVILRNSFEMLAMDADRVHVTYNISECLRTELEIGESTTNCLLYPAASVWLRQIIHALRDNTADRTGLARVLTDRKHHAGLAKDYLNHSFNKQRMAEFIDGFKQEFTTEKIKALRGDRVPLHERLNMIRNAAPVMLRNILQSRYKMHPASISRLIKQKPMLLRYHYLNMWLGIEWLRLHGFEDKPDWSITNDLLDREYVLTALSFEGIFSSDNKVLRAYKELRMLIDEPVI